jgi:hypothetical protein
MAACGSDGSEPGAAEKSSSSSASAPHACQLISANDALFVMGWQDVENVDDPYGSPVFGATQDELSSACLYQPVPDDGVGFAAMGVFTPEHMAGKFENEVADGVELTDVAYTAWNVDGAIFVREGDVGFLAIAVSDPSARDLPAATQLADTAVTKLANFEAPAPEADPSLAACRLLTEDVAEAALDGVDLTLDESHAYDEQRTDCEYAAADESFRIILYVSEGAAAQNDFDSLKKGAIEADRYTKVEGLGDEAFSNSDIFVISGDTFMDVGVVVDEEERDLEIERRLAEELLGLT